jgi:hypothetical protein
MKFYPGNQKRVADSLSCVLSLGSARNNSDLDWNIIQFLPDSLGTMVTAEVMQVESEIDPTL